MKLRAKFGLLIGGISIVPFFVVAFVVMVQVVFSTRDDPLQESVRTADWIRSDHSRALPGAGFAVPTNVVTLVHRDGTIEELPLLEKDDVAQALLDRVLSLFP